MMGPFGTNPVRIDSQGNHVEPSGIEERIALAIRDRIAEHGYPMSFDTARDLAAAVVAVLDSDDKGGEVFTVTTVSGFKMILEDAGRDANGNQLWRQVRVTLGRPADTDKPGEPL